MGLQPMAALLLPWGHHRLRYRKPRRRSCQNQRSRPPSPECHSRSPSAEKAGRQDELWAPFLYVEAASAKATEGRCLFPAKGTSVKKGIKSRSAEGKDLWKLTGIADRSEDVLSSTLTDFLERSAGAFPVNQQLLSAVYGNRSQKAE